MMLSSGCFFRGGVRGYLILFVVVIADLMSGLLPAWSLEVSYFRTDISSSVHPLEGELWRGYARLQFSSSGEIVEGHLCLKGRRQPLVIAGHKGLGGSIYMRLNGLEDLGVGAGLLEFKKTSDVATEFDSTHWSFSPPERKEDNDGASKQPSPEVYSIDLSEIPAAEAEKVAKTTRRQRRLAAMSLAHAFREELRRPTRSGGDGGIDPGKVKVRVNSSKVSDLNRFLRIISARPVLDDIAANRCGVPILDEEIDVVPLLESWSAAKIASSGLVISADVVVLPAGPGALALTTSSKNFMQVVSHDRRSVDVRDAQLSREFQRLMLSFAGRRRPNFEASGSVQRLIDNTPFFYRFEIKGLALARCDPNRWEKIVMQFLLHRSLTSDDAVGIVLQIQEGFFAMSPPSQPPADTRYLENRIPDGDLENLQQRMAGYLIDRGFSDESPGVASQGNPACK
ncbi:hypothetical protein [Rhodopseudomonas pseudopalustris]|uniref:Uncharacterized protein n=1 Tax=Rhodopseudomonas pseudopalustris TaxID=1513892 RepID=A0A1H8S1H3_9BRAD|nr:hypothetical protein [Rhodopseudomonas pseudopalustris]SEO72386.1 hypothetical protein SAMN05444123_104209 [Rhodopseudomonas pseudopalustris]